MVSILSHAVIAKHNQSCLVIHVINHFLQQLLGIFKLSFDVFIL